jgi:hypothetical protein
VPLARHPGVHSLFCAVCSVSMLVHVVVRAGVLLRFSCHTLHPADSVYGVGNGHGLETLQIASHFPVSDLCDRVCMS